MSAPPLPNIPEALYEPNLESGLDYETGMPRSLVLIPPRKPDISDADMDENALTVWLAAQNTVISVTLPLSQGNSHEIESRLSHRQRRSLSTLMLKSIQECNITAFAHFFP